MKRWGYKEVCEEVGYREGCEDLEVYMGLWRGGVLERFVRRWGLASSGGEETKDKCKSSIVCHSVMQFCSVSK